MSSFNYRKKPIVIQAFQVPPEDAQAKTTATPQWFFDAVIQNKIQIDAEDCKIYVLTLEGTMSASVGDYVIKGVMGELYPCKKDIFEATYEKV